MTYVLLTRAPVSIFPKEDKPLDLHVLSTPPAFVLSQDQTLRSRIIVITFNSREKILIHYLSTLYEYFIVNPERQLQRPKSHPPTSCTCSFVNENLSYSLCALLY
jgi:hypothetical protein